jgi:two-component system, cell cycle response regulator
LEAFLQPGEHPTAFPRADEVQAIREPVPASTVRNVSILAVGNLPANLTLMRCLLEPFGYDVAAARSVAEALARVHQVAPDLILFDLHVPAEDLLNVVREIRADAISRLTPLVIHSSTDWGEQVQTTDVDPRMCRVLMRPAEPAALLKEIESCLRERARHVK